MGERRSNDFVGKRERVFEEIFRIGEKSEMGRLIFVIER